MAVRQDATFQVVRQDGVTNAAGEPGSREMPAI